jgi:hypothetical protein
MRVPIAEILRPGRGLLGGMNSFFGIMHDYVDILASAHYTRRKEQILSQSSENSGLVGRIKKHYEIKKQSQTLKKESYVLAKGQINYLLGSCGLEIKMRSEYDELMIPEERKSEAQAALNDFVAKMNDLFAQNNIRFSFAVNSYIEAKKRLDKGEDFMPVPAYVMMTDKDISDKDMPDKDMKDKS